MNLEQLIRLADQCGASDIHLSADTVPQFRINGQLSKIGEKPLSAQQVLEMAKWITTREQFEQVLKAEECDFAYQLGQLCRLRVNIYKQKGSVALACRIIKSQPPTSEQLRLPEVVKSFVHQPQGLVLVTGPTGSGKTSTLAALINDTNETLAKHIITLEDPIEFVHQHKQSMVHQREIGQDSHSFAKGLRAALRQDPDLILVGEMRDVETIQIALTAAETGHLVLSTLHTTGAAQTINRIIDVFPAEQQKQIRFQLSSVLVGIVSQRLLPTVNRKGRVAAFEILVNTPAIANMIRSEKVHTITSVLETGRQLGMQTMEMGLAQLHREGKIDALSI